METTNIKYQILKSNQYRGDGSITNIKQKSTNKLFKLYSDADESFQINLKLVSPAIIKSIEIQLIDVSNFQLNLLNPKKQKIWDTHEILSLNKQNCKIIPTIFSSVQYVNLILNNNLLNKKRLGIKWLLVQGISDQLPNNKPNKKSTKSTKSLQEKDEQQYKTTKSKKSSKLELQSDNKQFFNHRSKLVTPKQNLIDFSQFDVQIIGKPISTIRKQIKTNQDVKFSQKAVKQKFKKQKQKQQQETQLAIALSKSQQQVFEQEYQKMEIQQNQNYQPCFIQQQRQKSLPSALENYIDQIYVPETQRTYDIVQLTDQYLQNFSDLTPRWLQAQRKAEQQANVRQKQRLSNHINIKYLYGTQIYIAGFPEWKKDQLQFNAKKLGCTILSQLKNNCLAIVSKQLGQKLRKKYKTWTYVKYITQNYLEECSKNKAKLNPSDYYIRF